MNYKVLIAAILVTAVAQADDIRPLPLGWALMQNGHRDVFTGACQVGVDGPMADAGQPNLTILCNDGRPGFGGLTQAFEGSPYWGQRVRFSAWLKAGDIRDIDGVAGVGELWILVPSSTEGPRGSRGRGIPLRGWTDWEYREFVVDIPEGGQRIGIGFYLEGSGQIWIKDLSFEVVSEDVPVNLAFEDNPVKGPDLNLE